MKINKYIFVIAVGTLLLAITSCGLIGFMDLPAK